MKRAAIDCRVSPAAQGIDRQSVGLLQFADRAGYEVVGTLEETVSGAKTVARDRPERAKVLAISTAIALPALQRGKATTELLTT